MSHLVTVTDVRALANGRKVLLTAQKDGLHLLFTSSQQKVHVAHNNIQHAVIAPKYICLCLKVAQGIVPNTKFPTSTLRLTQ